MHKIHTSYRVFKGRYYPTIVIQSNNVDCSNCGVIIDLHKSGFKSEEKARLHAKGESIFLKCEYIQP